MIPKGYILVLALVFLGIFFTTSSAYLSSVTSATRDTRIHIAGAQALSIAEAAMDVAAYQINQNPSYSGESNTSFGDGVFSISVSTIDSNTKLITATGTVPNNQNPLSARTIKAKIGLSSDVVSFHYGVQAGQGGFRLENSSKIIGNVYSGGSVIGTSQNYIYGDVVSSGASGLVYGIHATSSVYAHTIGNAGTATIVDKNAYYTTKTNTTVTGTSYPGSVDQVSVPLPISDEQISEWEGIAAAGGTATCSGGTYKISSGSVSLGPRKIPCDLEISDNAVITVGGHIWVTGNIVLKNSARINMASSLGAESVAIIADKPTDQLTSSKISVENSVVLQNSGIPGSFIFLISQNKSAETGGSVEAISLENSASVMVAYAAHGLIPIENSVSLKEVTAYKVLLENTATVTYDTGLPNVVFESGPGGSWIFVPGTYAITR
ncbi:hypothetical protein EXS57_00840 [Candidatus Kaiserbacteria bacterium]|nr:hypothetical protein [Candidatus Kaiserbacteria bacterium]